MYNNYDNVASFTIFSSICVTTCRPSLGLNYFRCTDPRSDCWWDRRSPHRAPEVNRTPITKSYKTAPIRYLDRIFNL